MAWRLCNLLLAAATYYRLGGRFSHAQVHHRRVEVVLPAIHSYKQLRLVVDRSLQFRWIYVLMDAYCAARFWSVSFRRSGKMSFVGGFRQNVSFVP